MSVGVCVLCGLAFLSVGCLGPSRCETNGSPVLTATAVIERVTADYGGEDLQAVGLGAVTVGPGSARGGGDGRCW